MSVRGDTQTSPAARPDVRYARKSSRNPLQLASIIIAARGAFRAAVAEWPDKRFTLRQGIRVLQEYPSRSCER